MAEFQVIYNESPGFLTNLISQGSNCSLSSISVQVAVVLGIVPLCFDSCPSRESGDIVNRSSKLDDLSSLNFIAAFGLIFRTNLLNNMFCVSTTFTKVLLRFLVLPSCFLTSLYSDPLESSSSAGSPALQTLSLQYKPKICEEKKRKEKGRTKNEEQLLSG